MTEYVYHINTGSTVGGNGTSDATVGANRAYVSLAVAEAARAADLDTANDNFVFKCAGTAADTTQAVLGNDWTTSATDNIKIMPEPGDITTDGVYNTGLYRLEQTGSHTTCLRTTGTSCGHVEINGLQMSVAGVESTCTGTNGSTTGGVYIFRGCILKGDTSGTKQYGINLAFTGTSEAHVVNNVIYDTGDSGINVSYVVVGQVNVYNNTVDNSTTYGMILPSGGSSQEVRNNVLTNCTTNDYNSAGSPTTAFNITSDTSSPQSLLREVSVTYGGSGDYSTATEEVVGGGENLSADSEYPFSTDILGVTRSAWDCGAFEHQAAGGLSIPIAAYHRRQFNRGS